MDPTFLIPLAIFTAVAALVWARYTAQVKDKEYRVKRALTAAENEHRRRMAELEQQLDRVKRGDVD